MKTQFKLHKKNNSASFGIRVIQTEPILVTHIIIFFWFNPKLY